LDGLGSGGGKQMSAKDYKICPALFKAYIAKTSKKDPNLMTDDRREITEQEIMSLIDWWLDKDWGENQQGLMFESHIREGMNVLLAFRKKED
jgi:hypothetical protein